MFRTNIFIPEEVTKCGDPGRQEKVLWLAVIEQAKIDLMRHPKRYKNKDMQINTRRIQDSADFWLNKSTDDEPGSFLWICDYLGLDPGQKRKQLATEINSPYHKSLLSRLKAIPIPEIRKMTAEDIAKRLGTTRSNVFGTNAKHKLKLPYIGNRHPQNKGGNHAGTT